MKRNLNKLALIGKHRRTEFCANKFFAGVAESNGIPRIPGRDGDLSGTEEHSAASGDALIYRSLRF
jgi:hypothetical protein